MMPATNCVSRAPPHKLMCCTEKSIANGSVTWYSTPSKTEICRSLPVDFPKPFAVPLGEGPTPGPVAGSSIKLLRELNALLPRIDAAMKTSGDAVARVKSGWTFMQECARLSVQHRLPIIFDG